MKVDNENMKGDAYQMKFDKIEEGKEVPYLFVMGRSKLDIRQ